MSHYTDTSHLAIVVPEYVLGLLEAVHHAGDVDQAPGPRHEVDVGRPEDGGAAARPRLGHGGGAGRGRGSGGGAGHQRHHAQLDGGGVQLTLVPAEVPRRHAPGLGSSDSMLARSIGFYNRLQSRPTRAFS